MRLSAPLFQFALQFDAGRLRHEAEALLDEAWISHPNGMAGNTAVVLMSPGGRVGDEFALAGAMEPTAALDASPYIRQVLAALDAPLSRTRLMRIEGGHQVPRHRDLNYHWYRRARVHVPIVTDPAVRFCVGDEEVHMRPGEAWVLDNFRPHHVENGSDKARIHLVVDVRGGDGFDRLLADARRPGDDGFAPRTVAFDPDADPALPVEPYGFEVLTPDEVDALTAEVAHAMPGARPALERFRTRWRDAFARFGHDADGEMAYAGLTGRLERETEGARIGGDARAALSVLTTHFRTTNRTVPLRERPAVAVSPTDVPPLADDAPAVRADALAAKVTRGTPLAPWLAAFATPTTVAEAAAQAADPAAFRQTAARMRSMGLLIPAARFDRPVFVVAAPRSGAALLAETLADADGVWSLGDDAGVLLDGIGPLHPVTHGWASSRLTAEDARPDVVDRVSARLAEPLRDRAGRRYADVSDRPEAVRLVDHPMAGALRVPFLRAAFPDARFVVVHRAARDTVSSAMDAWRSRRFVSYPRLPGWEDRMPWSFLLPEGWRDLADASLAQVCARQWAAATETLLADLAGLPADAVCAVRYDDLVTEPAVTVARVAGAVGLPVPEVTGPLPPSVPTLSVPAAGKWRGNADALAPVLPALAGLDARMEALCRTAEPA